jgi:hypothetical protein
MMVISTAASIVLVSVTVSLMTASDGCALFFLCARAFSKDTAQASSAVITRARFAHTLALTVGGPTRERYSAEALQPVQAWPAGGNYDV